MHEDPTAGGDDVIVSRALGARTRAEVLGQEHVDREGQPDTQSPRGFAQWYVEAIGWGLVWNRPGLDRRLRSLITVSALAGAGRFEELDLHITGARSNGVSDVELEELALQLIPYLGVPVALDVLRRISG